MHTRFFDTSMKSDDFFLIKLILLLIMDINNKQHLETSVFSANEKRRNVDIMLRAPFLRII